MNVQGYPVLGGETECTIYIPGIWSYRILQSTSRSDDVIQYCVMLVILKVRGDILLTCGGASKQPETGSTDKSLFRFCTRLPTTITRT